MTTFFCTSVIPQENTIASCSDGIDNDGNGMIDCQDLGCATICAESLIGNCITIDFENVLGSTPENLTVIENQFLSLGVKFSLENGDLPLVVDYMGDTEAFFGNGGDTPQDEFVDELGGFFLTDDGVSGGLASATIVLEFTLPVSSISGYILDIDNSETFTASAISETGAVISQFLITSDSPNTGNGIPSEWSLQGDGSCAWRVTLTGDSNSSTSFGYGLDNITICYEEAAEVCNCDNTVFTSDLGAVCSGCTNPSACNYNPNAIEDDDSCILPDGCTDLNACNFNSSSVCDDGSCDYSSCADCLGIAYGNAVTDTCGVCLLETDELYNFSCVGELYIPNAFTPDRDGNNEIFLPRSARPLESYEISIYNRWGTLLFFSVNPSEGWRGNDILGEYYVPNGIYTYLVKYNYRFGELEVRKGTVTLIR